MKTLETAFSGQDGYGNLFYAAGVQLAQGRIVIQTELPTMLLTAIPGIGIM